MMKLLPFFKAHRQMTEPAEGGIAWTASPSCDSDQNGRILKSDYSGRSFVVARRLRDHRDCVLRGAWRVSNLGELNVGQHGVVIGLDLPESVQNHLMHMGFVPDALVTALRKAPAGDPTVYCVDGMEIALRRETANAIRVKVPRTLSRKQEQELLESARMAAQHEPAEAESLR